MIDVTFRRSCEERLARPVAGWWRRGTHPFACDEPVPGTAIVQEALIRRLAG